jgi:hypothetical protein
MYLNALCKDYTTRYVYCQQILSNVIDKTQSMLNSALMRTKSTRLQKTAQKKEKVVREKRPTVPREDWTECRKRLKALQKELGLEDKELGRRMATEAKPDGESQQWVWNFFNYDGVIDIDVVARMSEAMGAAPAAMAYGSDLTAKTIEEELFVKGWRQMVPEAREHLTGLIAVTAGLVVPKRRKPVRSAKVSLAAQSLVPELEVIEQELVDQLLLLDAASPEYIVLLPIFLRIQRLFASLQSPTPSGESSSVLDSGGVRAQVGTDSL